VQYAFSGLAAAARHEVAFRLELAAVALLTPLALWLGNSGVERALLIGCLILVLIVELLNSAIEAAIDRISLDRHPLSKNAKDMGSAAQLTSLAVITLVWAIILIG
jgi:diacylglycerol kinase (ATP)